MEILFPIALLVLVDVAAWFWGADSRDRGLDPRSVGRPERWI